MRTHIIQTNFTAGEVSPKLLGRVDVGRYANAAKTAENVTVVVQGGLRRRDGLRYLATCKEIRDANGLPKPVRLIPWVYNREQAYVLEMGDKYMRIYQNGGRVLSDPNDKNSAVVEVTTPFAAEDLAELNYAQGADTMFFAHPKYPPQQLKRMSQTSWPITPLPLNPAPFAEIANYTPDAMAFPAATGPVGRIVEIKLADAGSQIQATEGGAASSGTGGYWSKLDGADNKLAANIGFKTGDVGKYLRINGGLIKITKVNSNKSASGVVRSILGYVDGAGSGTWTIEDTIWSAANGYPACVAMHQQRLLFANSKNYPQTVWGSAIREYGNFELGYMDDQAYSFTLSSDQINPISGLFSLNGLIALTHSGEFLINGGGGTITPTNINVRAPSTFGASPVRPIRVGTELMYIQRAGRKLLDMNYDPDSNAGFNVSNITLLSEHMTESGVVDMAYQQEPESLIHLVLKDGQLVTITFDKESEVTGWTRNHTGAKYDDDGEPIGWHNFMAIACVPNAGGLDSCYVVVERLIGTKLVQYVEMFQTGVMTDSALPGEAENLSNPVTEWTALEHLEGMEVDIIVEDNVMPRQKVAGGKVTLTRPAQWLEVGLPFYSRVRTLKPEFQTPGGTASNQHVATVHLVVRLLNSIGMTINGDTVPFRHFGRHVVGNSAAPMTGDVKWQMLGQDNNEVLIEQRQPLPFHVLAVMRTITAN